MQALRALLVLATMLLIPAARAEVPLEGIFTASEACPAYQSLRNQTNPGGIATSPGQAYELLAGNRPDASHYWIVVPGAQPDRRWVAVDCGSRSGAADTAIATQYVLAVSWQPSFCEGRANKPECTSQTAKRFDATHFSLHGLWPSDDYCSVSNADQSLDRASRWDDLPSVELSPDTAAALDQVMPGTRSWLERHEWIKHGTCYGEPAEAYFTDALAVMAALNASPVQQLFAANIGKRLTQAQIRMSFDQAFGPGTGDRVRIACTDDGNRRLIAELTLGLTGPIAIPADLPTLLLSALPTDGGCDAGIVDAAGLQ